MCALRRVPRKCLHVLLKTLDATPTALEVLSQLRSLPGRLSFTHLRLVLTSALSLNQHLQVLHIVLLNIKLMSERIRLNLQVIDLLRHELLVLLQLRHHALQTFLIVFLGMAHLLVIADLDFEFVALLLNLPHGLVSKLKLMRQVIDVALERLDLCDVVLLFLLQLFDHERGAAGILFHVQALLIKLVVLLSELLDGFLMALGLGAGVSVVLQDVLLVDLEGSQSLLSHALLLLKLL